MPLMPEQIEHINIVNWFNYEFPELKDDLHHFANERKCTIQTGRTLKRMGVKKGVFDFFLAYPQKGKHGFWIELKVGKNKPSPEQEQFCEQKILRGYETTFAWGFEGAKAAFLIYLSEHISNRPK